MKEMKKKKKKKKNLNEETFQNAIARNKSQGNQASSQQSSKWKKCNTQEKFKAMTSAHAFVIYTREEEEKKKKKKKKKGRKEKADESCICF